MKTKKKKISSMVLNCISIYKNRFLINHNFKLVFLIHITEVLKFSIFKMTQSFSSSSLHFSKFKIKFQVYI